MMLMGIKGRRKLPGSRSFSSIARIILFDPGISRGGSPAWKETTSGTGWYGPWGQGGIDLYDFS